MAEIKLQCPIKRGTKVKKWYATNTDLKSLSDFFLCQSQGFGENPQTYAFLGLNGHNGLDIVYENGTEVFASHDGTIEFAGQDSYTNGPAGLGIVIKGDGFKTIYWHLLEFKVTPGQQVKAGQLIALGDNTGFSSGPHLHWGIKLLDNSGNVLNRDNGFDGAIDPTPFVTWWNNMTQEEVKDIYKLAFYRLPDSGELTFWVGKSLAEFLKTAIKDRAEFLSQ